ncbi:MAG: DNA topoisomerase I [Candidatus Woesearchaeota archaeon]|jgi:DNA topoisomerase-1
MHEVIITEKPNAAKKIAEALASGKVKTEVIDGVQILDVHHDGKDIKIVSAVGHLYSLAEKEKSFKYPSFDIEWKPIYEVDKKAGYTKKYFTVLRKVSKDAKSFVIACDYDVEGEVIGLNVMRYVCKQKDASRMKFSTLTKDDIVKAYKNKSKSIDWGQAKAGETRHFLDWMYGINLSRALTLAVKNAGSFKILSSGRVQGPALKIIVDKEKEIKAFVPEPYWQITLKAMCDKKIIEALHEKDKFWKKEDAEKIFKAISKEKTCEIASVQKKKFNQAPPNPFDLGALQAESYRVFGISPKKTLQCAQSLYLAGVTSYPRTSSQKLPPELNLRGVLKDLGKVAEYKAATTKLLALKNLKPNEGKKTDPAHPAIYPTGAQAKITDVDEKKVYDLIVKRFFATFGEEAERETITILISVKKEKFSAKGTTTTKKGWHELYEPYVRIAEDEMPIVKAKDILKVSKIEKLEKETRPPNRYTPASIIVELEKRGLGTKATRADIVDSLYQRGYINEKSIEATELGMKIEIILDKYCPELNDEELTRGIEEEMEQIREDQSHQEKVIEKAKSALIKILDKIKKNELKIGKELIVANNETRDALSALGPCPVCKEGTVQIRRGKFGMFAACNRYPDCKTTYNLPKFALVKPAGKISPKGFPMILVIRAGKRPQELSLNPEENSQLDKEQSEEYSTIKSGELKKKCPKCGLDLRVMSSIFGEFLGCSGYPKCKYTESPNGKDFGKKKDDEESDGDKLPEDVASVEDL